MKKSQILVRLFIVGMMIFLGCQQTPSGLKQSSVKCTDTIEIKVSIPCNLTDTPVFYYKAVDSLKRVIRSKDSVLMIRDFQMIRANYYADIVARNPSQAKFFRGWIRRATDTK